MSEKEGWDGNGQLRAQRCREWRWGKGMFVASSHGKKMEEREGWVRDEEEWTMRCKVEEEGCKIKGEGGVGW